MNTKQAQNWSKREHTATRRTALRELLKVLIEDDEYNCDITDIEGETYFRIIGPRIPEIAVQIDEKDFRAGIAATITDCRSSVTETYLK